MKLDESVRSLPKVGPKREDIFLQLDITTLRDLIQVFPKKYYDRCRRGSLSDLTEEGFTCEVIVKKRGTFRTIRKNVSLFILPVEERGEDGNITQAEMIWFNQPWLKNQFEVDTSYYFFGKVIKKNRIVQMINPQFVKVGDEGDFFSIVPEYKKIKGIAPKTLTHYMEVILDQMDTKDDLMPKELLAQFELMDLKSTYRAIHFPKSMEEVYQGKRRIKIQEALKINLGILEGSGSHHRTRIYIRNFNQIKRFEANLPFELTEGQIGVLGDIINDFKSEKIMNRLVLGDVGSGKTIIAIICAYLLGLSGYQTAYMAPTEILAQQHAKSFTHYLQPYGLEVVLLTGGMKIAQRREALEKIASGQGRVIIGTHALIQKQMDYYNLGLVITDEQHRFGVKQRGQLSLKGNRPHALVMSATPIPRTLSLVLYGDLQLSVIGTMPKGRKKVKTYFYGEKAISKILGFMEKEMEKGYQALVVCPFIEESSGMEGVKDIISVYGEIAPYFEGRYKSSMLHGRMSDSEKKQVVEDYNSNQTQLLIATSIIEVGIDVPTISVIVILSAERFGLSQLHQLRGRVGRGDQQAYCFLVSNARSEKTLERMKVIVNQNNGQMIAEEDYRLRGPGDYFGLRQHGFPAFSALEPYEDLELIQETRKVAEAMMMSGKESDIRLRMQLIGEFYSKITEVTMN